MESKLTVDKVKLFSTKRDEYKYIRDSIKYQLGYTNDIYNFFAAVVEEMKDCDVLPMKDVLPEKYCKYILDGTIPIAPNRCWSNSHAVLISDYFADIRDDLKYCEGFADDNNGYPIEHGWLKYKDSYFDPTAEVIFPDKKLLKDYTSVIEVTYEQSVRMISDTKVHGYNNLGQVAKQRFNKNT